MPNFKAFTVLENMDTQMVEPRKPLASDCLNNEEVNNAAQILYEIANNHFLESGGEFGDFASTQEKMMEKIKGKRKMVEDHDLTRMRSHNKKVRPHVVPPHNSNDLIEQELCKNQNSSRSESGTLKIRIPPKKRFNNMQQLGSHSQSSVDRNSFSIIRLLTAVRAALVTPLDLNYKTKKDFVFRKNLPSLKVDQVVDLVRSKPLDPRILQCKEPLPELVRGVLRMFSSQNAPQGVMNWAPLTVYDRMTKTWKWTGPVQLTHDEKEIPSESWGLIMEENLNKCLVTHFSAWLTRVQPALQLIASLPSPPPELMQVRDSHERFKDRTKLNQVTIGELSNEIRAYFHREEAIRYLIPDRSFQYTNLDGEKSAVAPLRKSGEKATFTKTRGHYIFKTNRPPQFTLLSLVRDAAARLPGGVGTRADICALTAYSQYIVDDITEQTVKQIVSGALDRLRNELDPCVEYKGEWGLWVYLHRHRKEEEDFMENGS